MTTNITIPEHELPMWMKQARRGVDWGVLLVMLFSVLMAWAFLTHESLPRTNLTEPAVFRTANMMSTLQEGRIYPRWSAYALQGYGAPIPNFEPPGASYAAAVIGVLFTNDAVLAVRLLFVLCFVLAGTMTYVLVTQRIHAAAGTLSALLYLTSPQLALNQPHLLGDLPGMVALALLPALLWAVNRLLTRNQPQDIIYVGLSVWALLLTEPRYLLPGFFLCGLLLVENRENIRLVLVSAVAGISLAAFYWMPALLEQYAVNWYPPALPAPHYPVSVASLLAFPRQIDPDALVQPPQFVLGWPVIVLALLSAVVLFRRGQLTFQARFLLAGLIMLGVLLLSQADWLLGTVVLCFCMGGSGLLHLSQNWRPLLRQIVFGLVLLAVLALSFPVWLTPPPPTQIEDLSPLAQMQIEQYGYGISVLSSGAWIPSAANPDDLPSYDASRFPVRLSSPTLENQITALYEGTHTFRYQVNITETAELTMYLAYFPGWQATVDGQPLELHPDPNSGLIRLLLPEGINGTLHITMGATSPRLAGWVISVGTLLIGGLWVILRWRRIPPDYDDSVLLSRGGVRMLLFISLIFAAIQITPMLDEWQVEPDYRLNEAVFVRNRSEGGITLLAYDLQQTRIAPGGVLDFTLYWQAAAENNDSYQVRVTLRNVSTDEDVLQTNLHPPGYYPTGRWDSEYYVPDKYFLGVGDTAPGLYAIDIEMLPCVPQCQPENAVLFYNPDGSVIGTRLSLSRLITIENP